MIKSTSIDFSESFSEIKVFSHTRTHAAKTFTPRFEQETWASILYIERGNFQIRYATGEYLQPKGGTFYYHPPRPVKYQTEDRTITPYSMYHLAVDSAKICSSFFSSQIDKQEMEGKFPDIPFVSQAPPLMISSFKTIIAEFNERQSGYMVQIENSLRQIIISAIRSVAQITDIKGEDTIHMTKIDRFLDKHIDFMGPVERLFKEVGVSRSSGYSLFHTNFGISPKEYILRRKVVLAKEMLQGGKDISSIAYVLGFSSSQNFATTFKKFTCCIPSDYKKRSKTRMALLQEGSETVNC